MNISPLTNVSSPVSSEQRTISADAGASRVSSKDVASVSETSPSVRVSISASDNAVAAANTKVPPVYSRPTVADTNQSRFRTDQFSDEETPVVSQNSDTRATDTEESVRGRVSDESDEYRSSDNADSDNRNANNRDEEREARRSAEQADPEGRLSEAEVKVVNELKARDQEVRAHEQAHKSVGGQYTGAISYTYQSGPDGKRYAVGGEVPIDVSAIPDNPQATIAKMQTVKAAALAPAEPSPQDRAVAAQASRVLAEASSDLAENQREELALAREEAKQNRAEAEEPVDDQSNNAAVESFQKVAALEPVDESVIRQAYSIRL